MKCDLCENELILSVLVDCPKLPEDRTCVCLCEECGGKYANTPSILSNMIKIRIGINENRVLLI